MKTRKIKRLLSIVMTIMIALSIVPLSELCKIDLMHLNNVSVYAVDAENENADRDGNKSRSSSEAGSEEVPSYELYRSRMLLGLQEIPEGASSFNLANHHYNYYINEVTYNQCASFLQSCYEDQTLMAELNAWKAIAVAGAPSSAMGEYMKQDDYCMALILQAIEIATTEHDFLKYLKNETIKNSNDIIHSLCESLNISSEAQLIDEYSSRWGTSWNNLSEETILWWHEAIEKTGSKWLTAEKVTSIIGDVLSCVTDVFEAADKISMYASLSTVDSYTISWLYKMQNECPSDEYAMQVALANVINACSGNSGRWLTYIETCTETAATWALKFAIDKGLESLCSLHPVVAAIFAGFAAGKSLGDILFGTTDVCEQFAVLEWEFLLQDMAKGVIKSTENSFRTNSLSEDIAHLFSTSFDIYFNVIADVDADCMKEFLTLLYSRGLVNKIKTWLGFTDDLEVSLEAVEGLRSVRWAAYNSINDYILECYKLSFPERFEEAFGDSSINARIPILGIDAYLSIKPKSYPKNVDLQVGDFRNISIVYTPANTTQKEVEITSSDENVAVIRDQAVIGVNEGYVTVTVSSMYNHDFQCSFNLYIGEQEAEAESEDYYYTINEDGTATITGVSNPSFWQLEIPSEIDGHNVSCIGEGAFYNCTRLERVQLPNSIKSIDKAAFYNCKMLSEINFPSGLVSIGKAAFFNCEQLNALINCYASSIGDLAFYNCDQIREFSLSHASTYYGKGVFGNCNSFYKLTSGYILAAQGSSQKYNAENITLVDGLNRIDNTGYYGWFGLKSITIPSSVRTIGTQAFSSTGLQHVFYTGTSAQWNSINMYSSNQTLQRATKHFNCNLNNNVEIAESVIPTCTSTGFDTIQCTICQETIGKNTMPEIGHIAKRIKVIEPTCTQKGYTIYQCKLCKEFYEDDYVDPIGHSFVGEICSNCGVYEYLKYKIANQQVTITGLNYEKDNITIPNKIEKIKVSSISYDAFKNNKTIKSITIPSEISSIGRAAFYGCEGIKSIIIPNGVSSIGDRAFYGCTGIKSISIPDTVTYIGDSAFSNCSLEYVELGAGLTVIPSSLINAETLKQFEVGSSITSIDNNTFSGCKLLERVTIPNGMVSIGSNAFYGCESLTSIVIPESVKYIGNYAFSECSGLTYVEYNAIDASELINENSYSLFANAGSESGGMSVVVGDSVKIIPENLFWSFIKLYGKQDLPPKINSVVIGESVEIIGDGSFARCESLGSVTFIGSNLMMIDSEAFSGCGIESLIIPNSVTDINWRAFANCKRLSTLSIGDGVTYIDEYAFDGCPLEHVIMGNGLTRIPSTLIKQSSLKSFVIGNSVEYISESAFKNCTGLSNISIPASVVDIGSDAFSGCTSLAEIKVDPNNTEYCSDNNGVLYNKANTELIQYPIGNQRKEFVIPNSITYIDDGAFFGCNSLSSITIPNGVTSISEHLFDSCPLEYVKMGDGLDSIPKTLIHKDVLKEFIIGDSVESIQSFAFDGCSNLTNLTFGKSVNVIYNCALDNCPNLSCIIVPDTNPSFCSDDSGVLFNKDKTELIKYPVGNSRSTYCVPDSVKVIYFGAFLGCVHLESIAVSGENDNYCNDENGVLYNKEKSELIQYPAGNKRVSFSIPGGVNKLMSASFEECSMLQEIIIPDSVWSVGDEVFKNCTSLKDVSIPTRIPTLGDSMFSGCKSLESIVIPTGFDRIEDCMFENCSSLIKIDIPNSVTSIASDAFRGCTALQNLILPNSLYYIGSDAFEYCTSLSYLKIPDSVISIGSGAFSRCSALKSITIPSGVTDISDWLFRECSSLKSVYILGSVTRIRHQAFYDCSSLYGITIPYSVSSIDDYAFYNCSSLADVYYNGSESQWHSMSIKTGNTKLKGAFIHYNADISSISCSHKSDEWVIIKEPTATEEGLRERYCTECGEVLDRQILPNLIQEHFGIDGFDKFSTRTIDYKTSITFHCYLDQFINGAEVHWFVNGEDRGTGNDFTVSDATSTYTVQSKVIKDGKVIAESGIETVTVKSNFFQRIIAFIKRLFNRKAFIIDQR